MVVFVISFVTLLQIWISVCHVTEIITMKNLKLNWQLKIRKIQGCFTLLSFYFIFYNRKFVWPHGYNMVEGPID